MAEVQRLQNLVANLRARAAAAVRATNVSVVVGYTQSYSIFVHENLASAHPVGQAKFLEEPARTLQPELARVVSTAVARGASIAQGLVMAGLRLQRESQLLCPVDTGAMKGSAFTRLEVGNATI